MKSVPFEKIGEGSTANIYKISSDTCLKQYKKVLDDVPLSDRAKMKVSVFNILKTCDLPGLYKLRDIYEHYGYVSGYTYDYVTSINNGSLALEDLEYILYSINNLERIATFLTGECIRVEDTNNANTIISPDGLTIIDADMYIQTRDITNLRINNKHAMMHYVLSKLCNGKLFNREETDEVCKLFDFDYESDRPLALQAKDNFQGKDLKKMFR